MIPALHDYKILKMDGKYYTLDPYDLFAMPCLKIACAHVTKEQALEHINTMFEAHTREYKRLKLLGRGFPDND